MPSPTPKHTYLLFGFPNGWLAHHVHTHLLSLSASVHTTDLRLQDAAGIANLLDILKPTCVINCAGKTGRPNIDWCEDHKVETVESNVIGVLTLAGECEKRGILSVVVGTGCIFSSEYDPTFKKLLSKPIVEEDRGNFERSFYSLSKSKAEDILRLYENVLYLRIRMPVSDDLHPRSFVTKIKNYEHVVDVPNSHSILHDLVPVMVALAEHNETGILNFTNPGAIGHNEVLQLYKEIVDPKYEWKNFSMAEQSTVIKAGRSNCALDAGKLLKLVEGYKKEGWELDVPEIREAYRGCFQRMKELEQSKAGDVV